MGWLPTMDEYCLIGVDIGAVRCGFAWAAADATGKVLPPALVHPLAVLPTAPQATLAGRLTSSLGTRRILALIVGLPLNQHGEEGPAAQEARVLAQLLASSLSAINTGPSGSIPVHFIDERYSSQAALALQSNELPDRQRRRPGAAASLRRRREGIDAIVASSLLQAWLDLRQEQGT